MAFIQGWHLFKDGIHSKKYGMYDSMSTIYTCNFFLYFNDAGAIMWQENGGYHLSMNKCLNNNFFTTGFGAMLIQWHVDYFGAASDILAHHDCFCNPAWKSDE